MSNASDTTASGSVPTSVQAPTAAAIANPIRCVKETFEPRDIIKTLVVRRGSGDYVFVLVPGDREISWPKLRALLEERYGCAVDEESLGRHPELHGFRSVFVPGVADWVAGPRSAPLLVDAKIASDGGSWWLAEAFRGH